MRDPAISSRRLGTSRPDTYSSANLRAGLRDWSATSPVLPYCGYLRYRQPHMSYQDIAFSTFSTATLAYQTQLLLIDHLPSSYQSPLHAQISSLHHVSFICHLPPSHIISCDNTVREYFTYNTHTHTQLVTSQGSSYF